MSYPKTLTATLAGNVKYGDDQWALQLADRGGSARDRRRRTAGASLLRRRCGRRGLRDGVFSGIGFCPANGGGASVWPIDAHRAPAPKALCTGRDGGARPRGGLAPRSTTDLRKASAHDRDAEAGGDGSAP